MIAQKEYGTFRLASDLGEQQTWAKIIQRLAVFATRFATESTPPFATTWTEEGRNNSSTNTPIMTLWSPSSWLGINLPAGPVLAMLGALYLLWPCRRDKAADTVRSNQHSAAPEVMTARERDEDFETSKTHANNAAKNKKMKSRDTTNYAAKKSKGDNSRSSSGSRSESKNSSAAEWFDSLQFVPGGPLIVVQAIVYSGFINCLANLSFAPLHLNITSRMWQQVRATT